MCLCARACLRAYAGACVRVDVVLIVVVVVVMMIFLACFSVRETYTYIDSLLLFS